MPTPTHQRPAPPRPDRSAILAAHPFFKGFAPTLVGRLTSHATTRLVKANTQIYAKGDPGTCLFAVVSGTVRISVPSLEGKDAVFTLLNEGEIFGEIALLDGGPRSADIFAATDCELMTIDRRDFVPMVQAEPELAMRLIEILCARLRRTSEQVEDVMFLDLPSRLAKILLRMAGDAPAGAQGRRVNITQREIGQIIGMSRESTNKQLRAWEARKWVRLERGSIVVTAPDALAEIVEAGGEADAFA